MQKKELGTFLLKPFRSGETEKRNNAVRTELLKALGQAFDLHGVTEQDGRTTFSDEFMRRLSDILGPAFKRDVMLFNRLVAGDFEGLHKNDAPRMHEMVRDQLASLREKYGDNPPADDRPRVSLQLPGGQS